MPSSAASSGAGLHDLEVLDHILWPYPVVRVEQLIEAATERQLEEPGEEPGQAAVPVPATAGPVGQPGS
jgi:hypothetical protein